jgi:hypothetical protein
MRASRRAFASFASSASIALVTLVALLSVREASAAGTLSYPAARWYVETNGAACEGERTAFEREIRLACDAVGSSCGVVATPGEADLRAVLDCSEAGDSDAWSLVTRMTGGTVLSTVDLSGPRNDRLREAAVEVARDPTPLRSLAIETLRFSLSAEQTQGAMSRPAHTLGLAVSGTVFSGNAANVPLMFGARLLAGLEVVKSVRATLGIAGLAGGEGGGAARAFQAGAGIAFGAPFDPAAPVGVAVEGGFSAISMYPSGADAEGGLLSPVTAGGGYGRGSILVQWPRDGVRPFAGLSGSALTAPIFQTAAVVDLGVAFSAF